MFFILTIVALCIGVLLLRKGKIIIGYSFIVLGWLIAIISEIMISEEWDRGFIPFFAGLAFLWLVQNKIGSGKKPSQE